MRHTVSQIKFLIFPFFVIALLIGIDSFFFFSPSCVVSFRLASDTYTAKILPFPKHMIRHKFKCLLVIEICTWQSRIPYMHVVRMHGVVLDLIMQCDTLLYALLYFHCSDVIPQHVQSREVPCGGIYSTHMDTHIHTYKHSLTHSLTVLHCTYC